MLRRRTTAPKQGHEVEDKSDEDESVGGETSEEESDEESEDDFLNEDELGPVEDSYTEEDPQEQWS